MNGTCGGGIRVIISSKAKWGILLINQNSNTYVGIMREVNTAQREKIAAGIAVNEVGSVTLINELSSENAPCQYDAERENHHRLHV